MTTASSTASGGAATASSRAPRTKAPEPPEQPGVARVVAIANQKGGVGKSTTAVSLGAALAERGYRVLVVDLDPQGNASTGLGIRHEAREATVYDVIVAESPLDSAIVSSPIKGLDAVPATIDLAGAEIELVSQFSRETRLKKALAPIREGRYDFVLLDCPPSLGLLTINALTAAEELIVPIQCEYYALEGLGQLLRNVSLVQQNLNPGLRLSGIVMTMFDSRTKLSEQVVAEVQRHFGALVYDVIIPRTVRLSEAPGFGQPITVYDPRSKGAETYRELAREVALRPAPTEPMPSFDNLPTIVVPPLGDTITPDPAPDDVLEDAPTPHVHEVVEDVREAAETSPAVTQVPDLAEAPPTDDPAIAVPEAGASVPTTEAPPTAVEVPEAVSDATEVVSDATEAMPEAAETKTEAAKTDAPEVVTGSGAAEPEAGADVPDTKEPERAPEVSTSKEPEAEDTAGTPKATGTPTSVRPQRAARSGSRAARNASKRNRSRRSPAAPPAAASGAPTTAPEHVPAPDPVSPDAPEPEAAASAKPGLDDFWEEVDLSPAAKVRPPSSPVPAGELPEHRVVVVDTGSGPTPGTEQPGPTAPYDVEQEPGSGLADIGGTLDKQPEEPPKRRWRLFRKGGE